MGFGDNDHVIRELMRFIKMTSREFMFEDATRNGGDPNYKCRWLLFTPKFGKLILKRKRSADDVKSKKIS